MNRILKELESANDYITAMNKVRPQHQEDHENIRIHLMKIEEVVNELTIPDVVGQSEQLKAFAVMVADDPFAYLKDAKTLLKDFENL